MNEIELWQIRGSLKTVRRLRREIHDATQRDRTFVGHELRLELEGSMYLTEVHEELKSLEHRSEGCGGFSKQKAGNKSGEMSIRDYDIVADRLANGRFTIHRWIEGRLVKIDGYDGIYDESETLERLTELRPTGDTWIRDWPTLQPQIFRLVE